MDAIVWNEAVHSVGHPLMDEHHQVLFDQVNRFVELYCQPDPSKIDYFNALVALSDFVNFHFSQEERMLAQIEYPNLDGQEAEHTKLVDKIVGYTTRLNLQDLPQLTEFLAHWLIQHILVEDMQYKAHVQRAAE